MSEIENLEYIRDHGIEEFIKQQEEKYLKNGQVFCVHDQKWYGAKD